MQAKNIRRAIETGESLAYTPFSRRSAASHVLHEVKVLEETGRGRWLVRVVDSGKRREAISARLYCSWRHAQKLRRTRSARMKTRAESHEERKSLAERLTAILGVQCSAEDYYSIRIHASTGELDVLRGRLTELETLTPSELPADTASRDTTGDE